MLVTKPAPDFKAQAVMPDNSFKEVSLSDYKGKKVVLFFYPLDFTFVCPTEISPLTTGWLHLKKEVSRSLDAQSILTFHILPGNQQMLKKAELETYNTPS